MLTRTYTHLPTQCRQIQPQESKKEDEQRHYTTHKCTIHCHGWLSHSNHNHLSYYLAAFQHAFLPQGLACNIGSCKIWLQWKCLVLYSDPKFWGISPMSEHSFIFIQQPLTSAQWVILLKVQNVCLLVKKDISHFSNVSLPPPPPPINSHFFIPLSPPLPSQTSIIWPLKPRASGERCSPRENYNGQSMEKCPVNYV